MTAGRHQHPVTRVAAAAVLGAVLTGCAQAAAAPAAGRAPDPTVGLACQQSRAMVEQIRATLSRLDAGTVGWARASAQLKGEAAALSSLARSTSDETAPEAIQDVADAVAAYTVSNPDGSTRTSDLRAAVQGAVLGFATVCPVTDGGFESGTTGWTATGALLTRTPAAHRGSWAALLTNTGTAASKPTLTFSPPAPTRNKAVYDVGLWARSDTAHLTLRLTLTEKRGNAVVSSATSSIGLGSGWKQVSARYRVVSPGSSLTVSVSVDSLPTKASFAIDDAWVLHR